MISDQKVGVQEPREAICGYSRRALAPPVQPEDCPVAEPCQAEDPEAVMAEVRKRP
jgi:hypothetical protein